MVHDDTQKSRLDARLLTFSIERPSSMPLHRQVYAAIREAILDGRLPAGSRLPSTRRLAEELGVSRNTVLAAFEQLQAEGFLLGRTGSGTRVTDTLSPTLLSRRAQRQPWDERAAEPPRLSSRCEALAEIPGAVPVGTGRDFAFTPAMPALDLFPYGLWSRLAGVCARRLSRRAFAIAGPPGLASLREALATYVGAARGVSCTAEQVVVVSGAQQALDLAARALVDPGDHTGIENPGYPGARGGLVAAGARVVPIPVDGEGLCVEALASLAPQARLVYVSPSHQFPLGMTMSASRRLELLDWAHRSDAWVIEDDYDSEFRYSGQPLTALRGLDQDDRVVYVGTFSKSVFPALRLGFVVLPQALVKPFVIVRTHADLAPPILDQMILAEFLKRGHFARHVARMRRVYRARRDALLDAVHEHCSDLLEVTPDDMGLRLIGWLPPGVDDRAACRAAASHGVEVLPISMFYDGECPRGGLVLSFGATTESAIHSGVVQLAHALREVVLRDT